MSIDFHPMPKRFIVWDKGLNKFYEDSNGIVSNGSHRSRPLKSGVNRGVIMSLDLDLMVAEPHSVFDINITHNLSKMADALGVYEILWRPDELAENAMVDKIYVKNFLKPINEAIEKLSSNMDYYQSEYGPKNGWGSAETLLEDLRLIRDAIEENPDGYFEASI